MNTELTDYLNPMIPAGIEHKKIKTVIAGSASLAGYGQLVGEDYDSFPIEIVRWPAQGWRKVDEDCGDEGGTTEGTFYSSWQGDVLMGSNAAVGGNYVLGYNCAPESADENTDRVPEKALLWHANYHPDGGQLFYPLDHKPFVVPLALPGDDVQPTDFVNFWFDGSQGLYIHPNIWHEGVFTTEGSQRFFDRQGAVHARVSINFPEEFQCLLQADLVKPTV
ncbi:ureidoglycolate lyase [Mariniblastus fucicola]|uniref:Ureidoglycolate hydrolase n=1 Tax=Mariniblastus fucicola TaxID=980251 RepID=A0A5B9PCN4_9BACT|nr:ureidoglycolate lyase [Mariniblastus fucicola]QEG24024.1 ureidoglycolate hydrolase [Mariniblastus fucicola]